MTTTKAVSTRDANKLLAQAEKAQHRLLDAVSLNMQVKGWWKYIDGKQFPFDDRTLEELISAAAQKGYTLAMVYGSIAEFVSINPPAVEIEETPAEEEIQTYNPWA